MIRPYQSDDFDAVYALWQATLGMTWMLSPGYLKRMISGAEVSQPDDNFVAEQDGKVVGLVSTQTDVTGKSASILLLIVHPAQQRRGIGARLYDAAITHLRHKGIETLHLASGGAEYIWCGLPKNAPGAVEFFKTRGWDFQHEMYDMTRDLIDYQTPVGVLERMVDQGIDIRVTSADDVAAVQAFERDVFPEWVEYFDGVAETGRYRDILAAWDESRVVGSLLLEMPDVEALDLEARWHQLLGDHMGTIGAVGVDDAYRERGIGLALVARASEILRDRGVRQCAIGWTNLASFYGRVGYTVWCSYKMADMGNMKAM